MTSRPVRRAVGLRPAARVTARVAVPVTVLVMVLAATGCGTASEPSPPAGVDGLVVPTPSPEPGDFVAGVDNPWLPLARGSVWLYETGAATGSGPVTVTVMVTVADDPGEVAGVPTTVVEAVGGGVRTTDELAQDADGNVWWFAHTVTPEGVGEESQSWEAGVDGVEAGLAMPATPRVGDGWFASRARDGSGVLVRTVELGGELAVEAGEYDEVLTLEVTDAEGRVATRQFALGTGLLAMQGRGVFGTDLELTAVTAGPRPR